ncbi:hypothetical protein [Xanthomarina gelatinilytica]|jgi:Skp family chaperone for outer membrane proteins|uniref:hypothetical protein n=1 Tax=Xanthomarina gelatinilytica TaxID=1137281 RepID=UPI003AA9CC83
MKKIILLLALFTVSVSSLTAQTSCSQFENTGFESIEAYFADLKNALETNIPRLKETRQWARKNNKPQVETATNRLEYWAKKFNQFIDKHKESNIEAVCEKFENDRVYMADFAQLTIMFVLTNSNSYKSVDYSKYE